MNKVNNPELIFSPVPMDVLAERIADIIESRAAQKPAPSAYNPPAERKRLYGDQAAAEHIGCSHQKVAKLRKDDAIRYRKVGTRYYYYAHELDEDLLGGKHRFSELRGRRWKP